MLAYAATASQDRMVYVHSGGDSGCVCLVALPCLLAACALCGLSLLVLPCLLAACTLCGLSLLVLPCLLAVCALCGLSLLALLCLAACAVLSATRVVRFAIGLGRPSRCMYPAVSGAVSRSGATAHGRRDGRRRLPRPSGAWLRIGNRVTALPRPR